MATLERKQLREALADVDYPAGKDELVAHAERRDADAEVRRALRGLPPVEYRSFEEVAASVHVDVIA